MTSIRRPARAAARAAAVLALGVLAAGFGMLSSAAGASLAAPPTAAGSEAPSHAAGSSAASVQRRSAIAPAASSASAGTAGYCKSDTGVTVVVDMSALGGDVVVRCDPDPVGFGETGVSALEGAGFTVAGTQHYGLAFVCRIQNRPSASEALAIPGNPAYHEACVDTPPQTAFWAYWYAPDGGQWTYSSVGANTRRPISGGFEGWAFSLGNSDGSATEPGIDPQRPAAPPPPSTHPPSTHPPSTTGPTSPPPPTTPTTQPPRHHNGGGAGTTGPPTTDPTTTPTPTTTMSTTTAPATTTPSDGHSKRHRHPHHGDRAHPLVTPSTATSAAVPPAGLTTNAGVKVTGRLPEPGDNATSSSRPALVGVGVLLVLGLGAGLTAWRRTHRP